MKHYSVLKKEAIEALNLKEDGIYVDATLGYAGHSTEILKRVKKGFLFAFDQDEIAIKHSKSELTKIGTNFKVIYSNFKNIEEELRKQNIEKIDSIIFDLGVSSPQLDEEERGFSYHGDARLDMRMDQKQELSAYEVVNEYSFHELMRIFTRYGNEKYSKSIARKIEKERIDKPITTTLELVEIIKKSVPFKARKDKHPAKKVFQAIRMEVNQELEAIEVALKDSVKILKINGRLVVITFHSGEEKKVMEVLKKYTQLSKELLKLPNIPEKYKPKLELISKQKPNKEELLENNRSRSAVLRVFEKVRED